MKICIKWMCKSFNKSIKSRLLLKIWRNCCIVWLYGTQFLAFMYTHKCYNGESNYMRSGFTHIFYREISWRISEADELCERWNVFAVKKHENLKFFFTIEAWSSLLCKHFLMNFISDFCERIFYPLKIFLKSTVNFILKF